MNDSLRRAAFSLAVLLGSGGLLLAQQSAPPTQPRAGQREQAGQLRQPGQFNRFGGGQAAEQQIEPSILTLLIIDNNKEIALGQLGQQTSQNEHVKHFCEMLVKDHTSFVQKLQARTAAGIRAPGSAVETRTDTERGAAAAQPLNEATARQDRQQLPQEQESLVTAAEDRNLQQQGQGTRAAARPRESGLRITVAKPVISNQPGAALLQLHHELAEACLESAHSMAQKPGQEFDMHFMGAQIVAHHAMLDKLRVFQRHVSPETRQLLADAQQTVQKHLKEAQTIHESLSKHGGRDAAETRRGDRTTETTKERE